MTRQVEYAEELRLQAVRAFNEVLTEEDPSLTVLVEGAAEIYQAPVALLTLVDQDVQHFKAAVGTDLRVTPVELSFCRHTIGHPELLVVPDTTADARFFQNPLVTEDPYVRFYAGAPVITSDGFYLGAICVLDTVPRSEQDFDGAALSHLALLARTTLEHRRAGSTSPLVFPSYPAGKKKDQN